MTKSNYLKSIFRNWKITTSLLVVITLIVVNANAQTANVPLTAGSFNSDVVAEGTTNTTPAPTTTDAVDGTTTANGTHSTISAAITSASSGDTIFVRPGTYTENLTLKAGVNITAYQCDASLNATGRVTIVGNSTLSTAGSVTMTGMQLQTNSAAVITVSGSAASMPANPAPATNCCNVP